MADKKSTEKVYVLVHVFVGMPVVFGGLLSLLSGDAGFFYALGLLALGVVQLLFGLVGVFSPNHYRLKNNSLPLTWLGVSLGYGLFMYCFTPEIMSFEFLSQFLWFGIAPFIGLFQFVTFTYKGFKK